ncbi:MAG TPA: murein L,D-transpeptidase catalytic domain family protein [Pseudobdellovibrionaceae bacterium]|nr:murein L,D-transpeptidase catalytic domain family protein [Pseudobdellovibrionaceae bacterium]
MKTGALCVLFVGLIGCSAEAALSETELFSEVTAQGVPAEAFRDVQDFLKNNLDKEFVQDAYTCKGREETSVRPCSESDRTKATKVVTVKAHDYAVIVDYTRPSTEERFFVINMKTGEVEKMLGTHGQGSGNGAVAYKFSNVKDSRQTSLGMYLLGEVYSGNYGPTLRMYGLEKSNDQAYNRDIVMHGAWYADKSFLKKTNPNTKKPYGRLGVSWGCPAVSLGNQKRLVPLLKEGALIYHYHAELQAESRLGGPVQTEFPPAEYAPIPTPRPDPQAMRESNFPSSSRAFISEYPPMSLSSIKIMGTVIHPVFSLRA